MSSTSMGIDCRGAVNNTCELNSTKGLAARTVSFAHDVFLNHHPVNLELKHCWRAACFLFSQFVKSQHLWQVMKNTEICF